MQLIIRYTLLLAAAMLLVFAFGANAAMLSVASSGVGMSSTPTTANDLKPAACAGLNLTNVANTGTSNNDLLLGTASAATLSGGVGDDCIVGGAGADTLIGGADYDVCIGGSGSDLFDPSCEERIQ